MKYSWFINLTTEKQTMATRGVWHPLLPNTEVSNTTVSATRSALQQEAAIRRRRRADIQVNVVIPTHNFCSLVFVFLFFLKNLCLTEITWKGNVAGFLHLAQISYCLLLCGALSTMCQTPRCFELKKKKKRRRRGKNILWKWNCGRETNHIIASVQCCSKTEAEEGEKEKNEDNQSKRREGKKGK